MLQKFREAFRFFDKDGDGSIDKQELGRVKEKFGIFATEEELREMLDEIDIDVVSKYMHVFCYKF
ncbi:Methyl farnesoate epoxidase [Armadillidium vulgare]|nr:Methyl farnesoate epoxidase [Armadillidium vulgare]